MLRFLLSHIRAASSVIHQFLLPIMRVLIVAMLTMLVSGLALGLVVSYFIAVCYLPSLVPPLGKWDPITALIPVILFSPGVFYAVWHVFFRLAHRPMPSGRSIKCIILFYVTTASIIAVSRPEIPASTYVRKYGSESALGGFVGVAVASSATLIILALLTARPMLRRLFAKTSASYRIALTDQPIHPAGGISAKAVKEKVSPHVL